MAEREENRWVTLVLVCLAQFMVILDATIVNVALPTIQADLEFSQADLQWVINSYTLLFGGFLLLGGRAADIVGRKKIFIAGTIVFSVASLLNGLASTSGLLLGGILTEALSWEWIFFVNVPIGAVAAILSARLITESKAERTGSFDVA